MQRSLLLLTLAALLTGCSATPIRGGAAPIEPDGYADAFDRAREALVDLGFTLNRVDAPAGVITTQPLVSRGAFGPWERQQMTLGSEIADALHAQSRTVRVEFMPEAAARALPRDEPRTQLEQGPPPGSISTDRPMVAVVTVLVERRYRPGFRPQVADVLRSGRAHDPLLNAGRQFDVVIRRDERLEDALAGRIAANGRP